MEKTTKTPHRRVTVRALVALGVSVAVVGTVLTATAPASADTPTPTPTPTAATSPEPSTAPEPQATAAPTPDPTPTSDPTPDAAPTPTPGSPVGTPSVPPASGSDPGAYMGQGEKRIDQGKDPQDASAPPQQRLLAPLASWMAPGVQGLDVSGWQPNVDWQSQWNMGARFVYIKTTEGTDYTSSNFSNQWAGATNTGFIRGAYHFAIPAVSSGAAQANYFVDHGGGWSGDGRTLPPLLDIEYNPYPQYGDTCYNMRGWAMELWIRDFSNTILQRTGRLPAIYTTANWWNLCTNSDGGFGDNPLHIARYSTSVGPMPAGWNTYRIWQYSSTGPFTGDSNAFNGTETDLQNFAKFADGRGASLAKSSASPTVYIVNGLTKYPIPDLQTYSLYLQLGSIQTVAQSYLDGLRTGNPVGRFMQAGDGSIYFNDGSTKYHVQSCALMADFAGGANCAGYVPLPDGQINMYADGGKLTNAVRTKSGKKLYVSSQTAREYFDPASLSAAGLDSRVTVLSDAAVAGLPRSGSPIVRPDVIVVSSDDGKVYLFTQNKLVPIPASINDQNVWSRSITAALMDNSSISQFSTASAYTGFVTNAAGTAKYLVTSTGKLSLSTPSDWSSSFATFSDALLASLPAQGSLSAPAYLKSNTGSTLYWFANGKARAINTWTTYASLNQTGSPIIGLTQAVMDGIAKGPDVLSLPSQVVGSANPMVYVVDGLSNLVPIEDFAVSAQLGINGYTRVSDGAMSSYTKGAAPLTPVVTCGSAQYLGRSSGLVRLAPGGFTSQLPTTTLGAATCASLGASTSSPTLTQRVFVKTSAGATVYALENGKKRPVGSWGALVAANGGNTDPVIATYGPAALAAIPVGTTLG